jgi:hypothetical protein
MNPSSSKRWLPKSFARLDNVPMRYRPAGKLCSVNACLPLSELTLDQLRALSLLLGEFKDL